MKSLSTALSGVITPLKEKIASFIYPSHCIHCNEKIESHKWLCSFCAGQIEFAQATSVNKSSTLLSLGSSLSFLKAAKGPLAEEVAKAMAAFMVMQLERLSWPLPDTICPSPRDPFNILLSKHLSIFLNVTMIQALKLPGLFSPPGYKWRGTPYLSDQRLLIVDTIILDPKEFSILEEAGIMDSLYLSFV